MNLFEARDEYFAELRRQGKKPKYWEEIQEEGWAEYHMRENLKRAAAIGRANFAARKNNVISIENLKEAKNEKVIIVGYGDGVVGGGK